MDFFSIAHTVAGRQYFLGEIISKMKNISSIYFNYEINLENGLPALFILLFLNS